jgi:dihydroorotase
LVVDLVLYGCKVYTSKGLIEAGIAVDKDKIVRIAKEPNLPKASVKIDLKGNLALPGLIDSHVHLRDQQLAYREDFETGTSAAAAGGVTTVIDMPNNQPFTMSADTLQIRLKAAEPRILVNVAFNSGFPSKIGEVSNVVRMGAVGFKLFLIQQLGGVNIDDDQALLKAFKAIKRTRVPIAVHAEDRDTVDQARNRLKKLGQNDLNAFLKAHTAQAEKKAIQRVIGLGTRSQADIHVCHVSSKIGLDAVLKAKKAGYKVTCEVTPHHLLLSEWHLKRYGKMALEIPPLRPRIDIDYLWHCLHKGFIDTIGSDHAPHSLEEKEAQSTWDVRPGIVGLETMLPLLLTQVNNDRLQLKQLIHLTCEAPAEIYSISDRGRLESNYFADITIVDLKKQYKIDASKFHSKAKFSPFNGWKVKGKAVKTFVNGQLVMDNDEIVAKPGTGRIVT